MNPLRIRFALICAAVATAVSLGGCVFVVESDSHYCYGRLHGGASLEAIHPGVTTRAWVVENLGQPSSSYLNEVGAALVDIDVVGIRPPDPLTPSPFWSRHPSRPRSRTHQ